MKTFSIVLLTFVASLAQADDTQSLRQMIDASAASGIPVVLKNRTYEITSQITVKSGVRIEGNGATIRAVGKYKGGVLHIEPGSTNISLLNLRIVADRVSFAIQVTSCDQLTISGCDITGAVPGSQLLDLNGTITRTLIERTRFSNALHLVRLRGAVRGTVIRHCEFSEWVDYATYLVPAGEVGPEDTLIENNNYHSAKAGLGGARQMIVAYPDKVPVAGAIRNLRIVNNDCIGWATHYDRTSPTSRATADQISLHYCDGILLNGNRSLYGGENGIVVTNFCRNVVITANESSHNQGHGIQVSSLGERTGNVLVSSNFCHNNGCRAGGTAAIPERKYAGIYIHDGESISLYANRINDDRDQWLQQYGILISVSTNIDLGPNSIDYYDTGGGMQKVAVFDSTLSPLAKVYRPEKPKAKAPNP